MKRQTFFQLAITGVLLLSACGAPQETPTPTIEPTATPVPTPSAQKFIDEGSEFLGNYQYLEAEQAFKNAIEVDPGSATAHANLALTYLKLRINFEEMLVEAQKAVELNPDDGYSLAVLAYIQDYQMKRDEALKIAESAYEKNPENDFVARCMAYIYLGNNDVDKAWEVLDQLIVNFPEDAKTFNILGDYFFHIAEYGTARAAYLRAADLDPENLFYKNNLAYIAYQSEDYDQAVAIYEEILAENPDYQQALLGMIDIHLDRYEFDLANEKIDKFAESNPDDYRSNMAKGNLLFFQEEYSDAIAEYRKALELNPFLPYSQFQIGFSYIYQDECERARIHFQDLVEEYPHVLIYQVGESNTDMCTNRIDQAIRKLKEVIEKDPYLTGAHLDLGFAYTLQSRWEDAEDAFSEALSVAAYPSTVHKSIASMLNDQGFAEKAEKELIRAIELNPFNIQAYYDLTFIMLDQDRFSEATETIQKAAEINTEDVSVQYAQGITHYFDGEYNDSITAMTKVLDKEPDMYYAHLFLGLSNRSIGKYEEARNEIENYFGLMQDYLSEEDTNRISFLLQTLDDGYTITEDEAVDSVNEFLGWFDLTGTNPRFEIIEEQRNTMVFDLNITPAELENEQFMVQVGLIMGINAFFVPRVTPTVDGGAQINVKVSGRDSFTVRAPISTIEQYADTLISSDEFISALSYTMPPNYVRSATYNRIITDVSEVREIPLQRIPPQFVSTKETLREETAESVDEQTQEAFDQEDDMLTLLEVIPPEYDYAGGVIDMYSENIAGYYVPSEDAIYLVELEQLSQTDQLVLAHESTHALQYQNFDMNLFDDLSLDDDQQLAFLSLIEGDATLSSVLYMNEYIPTVEQLEIFSSFTNFDEGDSQDYPGFLINFLNFPYDYGFEFVNALYDKGGWEEVNQAYENPPVSSEQILHPDSYFDNDIPLNVDLTNHIEELAEDWEEIDKNVMGEYGIYLILEEYFGPYAAYEAARGWGGDQYVFLQNTENKSQAFMMQVDWDDMDEAQEFWLNFKVAMHHRNQYQQIVDEFILEPTTRVWHNGSTYVLIHLDGRTTYLLIGAEQSDLEQILAVVLE